MKNISPTTTSREVSVIRLGGWCYLVQRNEAVDGNRKVDGKEQDQMTADSSGEYDVFVSVGWFICLLKLTDQIKHLKDRKQKKNNTLRTNTTSSSREKQERRHRAQ